MNYRSLVFSDYLRVLDVLNMTKRHMYFFLHSCPQKTLRYLVEMWRWKCVEIIWFYTQKVCYRVSTTGLLAGVVTVMLPH